MSPLHHKRGPNLSSFQGSSGVTLASCEPANKRAAPKSVENTSEMDRKPNNKKLRRCWRALSEMEEWKLTLLLYISSLSLWGLCVVVLPCAPTLLAILGLGIFTIWCPKSQGKGTSEGKSSWRSRRKDPIGASIPWEGVEESMESLKAGFGKPHRAERWESSYGRKAASAGKPPQEMRHTGPDRHFGAGSSSELLENQLSISNMEELSRSLMASLDIMQICLELLGRLRETQESSAPVLCGDMRSEYLVCLQCRQCLTDSCPHCREPAAEQDLPVLAAILRTADILVHEEDFQVEMGLGFELTISGELAYVWEVTQRLPEIPLERCCALCHAPLPRGPEDSESPRELSPILGSQGTPEVGLAGEDERAPSSDTSGENEWAAGQEEPLPSAVPTQLPWEEPRSASLLERLRRVRREPLPWVGYKGLGQGLRLQRLWQSWSELKTSVRRSAVGGRLWSWVQETLALDDTEEEEEVLPPNLRFKVDALFHAMTMEA